MHEGAAAPSYEIRSGGMYGARDRSLPRPVGETGRRSVGNRKERCLHRDYASFPDSCPSGGILWARPLTFPYREAMKGKSSQGAKRTLTVGDRTARFFRSSMQTGKPPFPEGRGFGMRMRKEGLCASRLQAAGLRPELSPASPLRPAFFGLRMGTLGDFIPQTPSSLRAVLSGYTFRRPAAVRASCR